jgi:hypothetical protein
MSTPYSPPGEPYSLGDTTHPPGHASGKRKGAPREAWYIVGRYSWPWIFYVNLPIDVVGTFMRREGSARKAEHLELSVE